MTPKELMERLENTGNHYSSFKKGTKFVHFSTGGWSENEDLVSELEKERVWHHFLVGWKSGGHYKFIIPPNSLLNYDFKNFKGEKQDVSNR